MERKESPAGKRAKRTAKPADDSSWDCSVCTYRNTAEAFKCLMCDVRKGTSTRKPRLNQDLQQVQTYTPPAAKARRAEKKEHKLNQTSSRLRGVDRSAPTHQAVTINDVTVIITEYKRKRRADGEKGAGAPGAAASGASTGDASSLSESDPHSEASNPPPDLQTKPAAAG